MLIEIFSDIICPWCFIGKQRLDAVLAGELGHAVDLRWRAFQLYPGIAPEGVDRVALLQARYGDKADTKRVPQRILEEAAAEGIELRYDLIQRTPNTMLAHELMELAYASGVQHALAEQLFRAYFCDGRDVGDLDTLVTLGEAVGMSAEYAREALVSRQFSAAVITQIEQGRELGVSGVPAYYLGSAFLLPGAQSRETMQQIISRVQVKIGAGG